MDIEDYSKIAPQYYSGDIPELLEYYLKRSAWNSLLDCGCGDGSLLYALNAKNILKINKFMQWIYPEIE